MTSHKPKVLQGLVVAMFLSLSLSLSWSWAFMSGVPECSTVAGLVSACTAFVAYGYPHPFPGSPCCHAMTALKLNVIADSIRQRRMVCRCFMGMIASFSPNATAIASLPGLCGVSLGFTIDPNADCNV